MFVTYFVVALIAGQLTARIRAQERHERRREDRATALFRLTQALSAARTLDDAVFAALRQADALFAAQSALLLGDGGAGLTPHFAGSYTLTEKARGVADWAWRNRKKAGRFTDTLPSAEGLYLPLVREDAAVGVLVVRVAPEAVLSLAQRDLAESFATQLAVLSGPAENLATADEPTRATLTGEIRTATRRLTRLVNNLLDQTRLESGALKPRLDWCDAHDLVNAAVDGVQDSLAGHPFESDVPADLPLFRADAALMEQVIANRSEERR